MLALLIGLFFVFPANAADKNYDELKKLDYVVYVPTYTPRTMKFHSIKIDYDSEKNYSLKFCAKPPKCFVVESGTEFGDVDSSSTITQEAKHFGKFTLAIFPPNSEGNNSIYRHVVSTWMKPLKNPGTRGYHVIADDLAPPEVMRIVQSLVPLQKR